MTFSAGVMRMFGGFAFTVLIRSTAGASRLDVIDLPTGFFPGGIALGEAWTVYVGSNADGSIWKGDLSTGEGEIVFDGGGAPEITLPYPVQSSYAFNPGVSGIVLNAPGMDYDRRSGYLFVAGGYSGIRIYDAQFDVVAAFEFDGANRASFVGDVIVTKTAAYFTDSIKLKLHVVELNTYNGGLARDSVGTLRLPWYVSQSGEGIDLNGIEVTDDGKTLILGHTTKCQLFAVDLATGDTNEINLDGHMSPDGMVLRQNTLWVVENGRFGAQEKITEVSLSSDLTCGYVVPRSLTNKLLNNPLKMVRKGNSFYAANSKFVEDAQGRPTTSYEIVRVDRDSGEYECTDEDG